MGSESHRTDFTEEMVEDTARKNGTGIDQTRAILELIGAIQDDDANRATEALKVIHDTPMLNAGFDWIDHCTPLMSAISMRRVEIAKMIMDAGGEPNVASDSGETALLIALQNDDADAVRALESRGAGIGYVTKSGWSAMRCVIAEKPKLIPAVLGTEGRFNGYHAPNDDTAFGLALAAGNEALEQLIVCGLDLKAKFEPNGYTYLHMAAAANAGEACSTLVRAGADVNARSWGARADGESFVADRSVPDGTGVTPLDLALTADAFEVVPVLLELGADARVVSGPYANPPLVEAVLTQSIEAVRSVLAHGADVSATESHGMPALFFAVYVNSVELCDVLLDAGADPDQQPGPGAPPDSGGVPRTPLTAAILTAGHVAVGLHLFERVHGAEQARTYAASLLFAAAEHNVVDVAEELLAAGVAPDVRLPQAQTPLHVAAGSDALGVAKVLVDAGADVNAQDSQGNTPLHLAYTFDQHEMIEFLLERSADPSMCNNRGFTPSMLAGAARTAAPSEAGESPKPSVSPWAAAGAGFLGGFLLGQHKEKQVSG